MNVDRPMKNWKLTVAYDGTDFHGWQIQPGNPTIQGTLAEAIASVTGERTLPQGSGRTDAGVHAEGQVASFELAARIPAENLKHALNRILPASIRVLAAEHAPDGFHARHSAVAKIYRYRLFAGKICPPSLARYVAAYDRPLDLSAMQQAAARIVGEHDFTSFAASDPDRTGRLADILEGPSADPPDNERHGKAGNIRRIELSRWYREENFVLQSSSALPSDSELWTYTVRGNGFLHHMVRNLVGTFLEIGRGRMTPDAIDVILDGRNRSLAGSTAPARGLCLVSVLYGTDTPADHAQKPL